MIHLPPYSTSLIKHLGQVSGVRCCAAGPREVLVVVLVRSRIHTRVQSVMDLWSRQKQRLQNQNRKKTLEENFQNSRLISFL